MEKKDQCFLRKNTPEIRERLKKEGFKLAHLIDSEERSYGILFNGKMMIGTPRDLAVGDILKYVRRHKIVNCRTDVDEFIKTVREIIERKEKEKSA